MDNPETFDNIGKTIPRTKTNKTQYKVVDHGSSNIELLCNAFSKKCRNGTK